MNTPPPTGPDEFFTRDVVPCPDGKEYSITEYSGCASFDTEFGPITVGTDDDEPYELDEIVIEPYQGCDEALAEFVNADGTGTDTDKWIITETVASVSDSKCLCCDCKCCACEGYWSQVTFTISGVTGSTVCVDSNGSYTLTNLGGDCLWSAGGPPPAAAGNITPMALPNTLFTCEVGTGGGRNWQLVLGEALRYISDGRFTCSCGGPLVLDDAGACSGAPAEINVTVGGTWTPCNNLTGDPPSCGASASATAPKPAPVPRCVHLGPRERLPDGREWYACTNGYGSRIPLALADDPRQGKVVSCSGCSTKGAWRLGRECGSACPGYAHEETVFVEADQGTDDD